MGTDRYAYLSRIRAVDPVPKLWFSLGSLLICLFSESAAVGVLTTLLLCALTVAVGGQRPGVVLHFMKIPLAFLVIGCITILFRPIGAEQDALWSVWFFERFRWGVTAEDLHMAAMVFCKAMGSISAMYFLALNTPITDLTMALERLHVPNLLVELMELIYRFIFVLSDTARRIRTAQESRLGYQTWRQGMQSMGELASVVFLRAWRRGDRVYAALESRGYTGTLSTLHGVYQPGRWLYLLLAGVAALQLAAYFLERGLLL